MKVFGFSKGDKNGPLQEMDHISICFSSYEDAEKFADFARSCADEMRLIGTEYCHVHFAGGETPDIQIARMIEADT